MRKDDWVLILRWVGLGFAIAWAGGALFPRATNAEVTLSSGWKSKHLADAERIAIHLRELISMHFPQLQDKTVELRPLTSKSDFFQARTFQRGGEKTFCVYANPRLFQDPPSERALRAILVHEISHLSSYQNKSGAEMAWLGLRYVLDAGFKRRFERKADRVALGFGHAHGLKEYREWLYPRIPPHAVAEKRRNYFTPEEISLWIENHPPNRAPALDFH